MNTEQKIEAIKEAIRKADDMQSKSASLTYEVPALTSLKIRNLLNNIGALGTNYLEVGVHRGGTFTASIAGNDNLKFVAAVDSFESDMSGEGARVDFLNNAGKHKSGRSVFNLVIGDSFEVDLNQFVKNVDIYLYDGGHSFDDQKKALTYYYPILADEFIYLCDDWTYERVKDGTMEGIKEAGLEVLFEKELLNETPGDGHLNDEWWRGFYVALLKKKK